MGVRFNIDKDKIELILEYNFSVDDVIHTADDAISQTVSPLPILVDTTNSYETKPQEDLEEFANYLGTKREHIVPRVAILVSHEVRFGIGRQVGAYLELNDIENKPFYDKVEALDWLSEK
jgi:predicted neutral ceramidase superfamily lipid hydrolase